MQISILTLFPQMFSGPFSESIVKRAQEKDIVSIEIVNIRDFSENKHHTTDLPPYGGGPGMVMTVQPIEKALEKVKTANSKVILLSAKGKSFTQEKAQEYTKTEHLIFICGHYEGVDERVAEHLIDEEIRIGNYVLTGGELPAMVIADSVVRLLPGALGDDTSTHEESHSEAGVLEYPQYTRPADYNGWKVPDVLLSGNHAEIEKWRSEQKKQDS
ncbi:MAG: tRNA (guanosine(37)-N1)-methyltransferase TrmD [Candidatus Woesebacteria bacterium]